MLFADLQVGDAQEVHNTSYITPSSERVLRLEVAVPAKIKDVWGVLTTEEGWKSWATPVAEYVFKVGGKLHTHYRLGAKIGDPGSIYNSVLCYVPNQMFSMKIELNETFPEKV